MLIKDMLKGATVGRAQTVGIMTMVPLIMEKRLMDMRFVSPNSAEVGTKGYGNLQIKNKSNIKDSMIILPMNTGYIVKQSAQDHALPGVGLVKGSKSFDNAACIQNSQTGFITDGNYEICMLPFSMREDALQTRKKVEFGKLWNSISRFNNRIGLRTSRSHLVDFVSTFEKELDEFIAEFELVKDQVGALIIINDEIVGIEKTPSSDYFRDIFTPLIRECYGSLTLEIAKKNSAYSKIVPPKHRKNINNNAKSFDELFESISDVENEEKDTIKNLVKNAINESLVSDTKSDQVIDSIEVKYVNNDRFNGQIVKENDFVVYCSLGLNSKKASENKSNVAKDFKI